MSLRIQKLLITFIALLYVLTPLIVGSNQSVVIAQERPCSVKVEELADRRRRIIVNVVDGDNVNALQRIQPQIIHPDSSKTVNAIKDGNLMPNIDGTTTINFVTDKPPVADPSEYTLIVDYPTDGSTGNVSCSGATDLTTGSTDTDLDGDETEGPSADCYDRTNPTIYNSDECVEVRNDLPDIDVGGVESNDPTFYCHNHTNPILYNSEECEEFRSREQVPTAPSTAKPKDPCANKTGADKTSCKAREACQTTTNREAGKVFARAFNNACVTLPEFITTLINYVMMFASVIAGFMFLQGGIKIIASRGNPTAVVEARSTLLHAAIGLVLLATSYVIINFLSNSFGYGVTTDINLLGPFVP